MTRLGKCGLHALVLPVYLFGCGNPASAPEPEPDIFVIHKETFSAADVEETQEFRGIPLALGNLVGDDKQDLVVGNRSGGLWVFENTGNLEFSDVTESLALPSLADVVAVAIADMVGDEETELLVALRDEILVMAPGPPASIVARAPPTALPEYLLPLDADGDGRLELLIAQRSETPVESLFAIEDGNLVPSQTQSLNLSGRPWSATVWDVNGDALPDLHIANDTLAADYGNGEPTGANSNPRDAFFLGHRDKGFEEQPEAAGLGVPRSSMGGRLLDIEDERTLLLVSDLGRNKFFEWQGSAFEQVKNLGLSIALFAQEPCYSDARYECLIFSWSTAFADFDLDGTMELLVGNALSGPVFPRVLWYEWKSQNGSFTRRNSNLDLEAQSIVASDLDRDGDIDLVVAGRSGPPILAENIQRAPTCPRQLRLLGRLSGTEGRGAIVTAYYGEAPRSRHRIGSGGAAFVSEATEHTFGRCDLERLEIQWPSGRG